MVPYRRTQAALMAAAISLIAAEAAAQETLSPEVAALIEAQAAKIRDLEARLARLEARRGAHPPRRRGGADDAGRGVKAVRSRPTDPARARPV